jgi:hypothetical protein
MSPTGRTSFFGDIELFNTQKFINGVYVVNKTINYNDSSPQTIISVDPGECVVDAYFEVTTPWATGTSAIVQIGDGTDNDGFLSLTQGYGTNDISIAGYKGVQTTERGAYLNSAGSPLRKMYNGSVPLRAYITPGTATAGAGIVSLVIQKLE